MYLLVGNDRALLLDTGASRSPALFPICKTVHGILINWLQARHRQVLPLVVCHSHSHGDHIAGDLQFATEPNTTVVATRAVDVQKFFGFTNWPLQAVTVELGGRILDAIPIPGHEDAHIALYDRNTKLLLTGDSLYPGLLIVRDWPAYRMSMMRLKKFADAHEVSAILGAHIEMKNIAGKWFGMGTLYQPGEHGLALESRHLTELADALEAIGDRPRIERHSDFIIFPAGQPMPPPDP